MRPETELRTPISGIIQDAKKALVDRLAGDIRLLILAEDALRAATVLLERGYLRDVVSKSYCAMFYAANAAVVSEALQANKHSSAISLFGRHFVKSGRIAVTLHRALRTAFDERQLADYTLDWQTDRETVETRLVQAQQLVSEVSRLLSPADPADQ